MIDSEDEEEDEVPVVEDDGVVLAVGGQPLGVAVVGGLLLSQLLTLYITPVVYLYLDRIDRQLKRRLEPQLEEVDEHQQHKPAVAAE